MHNNRLKPTTTEMIKGGQMTETNEVRLDWYEIK